MKIANILKHCPEGTKLYSPIYGEVTFKEVTDKCSFIGVVCSNKATVYFTEDGRLNSAFNGECMLFPSKENRDWDAFERKVTSGSLPFNTPVIVSDGGKSFLFGWYLRGHECKTCHGSSYSTKWNIIIPFEKFNPLNIAESLTHDIFYRPE